MTNREIFHYIETEQYDFLKLMLFMCHFLLDKPERT